MKLASVEAIARGLDAAGVRYLVVGGLAVIAHGYGRLTMDVDLVVQLEPGNVVAAFDALGKLGYRPRVPVTAAQFANPALRREWIETKDMKVLNLHSDHHRETSVDVFVIEPFDFDTEYARSTVQELAAGTALRIVHRDTLIAMKEAVGRPRDLDDAWHLKHLRQELRDADTD